MNLKGSDKRYKETKEIKDFKNPYHQRDRETRR